MAGSIRTRLNRDVNDALRAILPERLKVSLKRLRFAVEERSFRPYTQKVTFDGRSFAFYVGDAMGHRWYGGPEVRELSPELAFIRDRMVRPGDVALDCGAHHGMATILLADWVGRDGKVIAFEASPHSAAILRKNVELNHLSQVRCENMAIASQPGVVRITEESNTRVTPSERLGQQIESINIDQFVNEKPTFLKIDIEGFEVEALKGAQQVLALHPKFMIEVHTKTLVNFDTSLDELLSLIDFDSYDVWIQWNDEDSPVPYLNSDRERITDRVHLFGLPKASQ
ncbi:FkbM family methyltransferase [Mycobacterium sp. IS-1590]|uniref:FkbM family methyltransferase n=1 Tax=Mycobacterium sp. IS-1590 TaxID=1772286 RepID=UPI0009EB9F33|nr:FkbM family methyltransferase [Mycobacterium sp. IS-1590]